MNSFLETLMSNAINGKECRTLSKSEIPSLVEKLVSGMETEESVNETLKEALTKTSEEPLTLTISKKDFGDLLLVFQMLTNCSEKLAETAMTLQGLTGMFKKKRIADSMRLTAKPMA